MDAPAPKNPLLNLSFELPFDELEARHVRPAIEAHVARARENIEAIEAVTGARTYENTLGALDAATEQLEVAMTVIGHLESAASTPELRDAYNEIRPEVSAFFAGIPLRPKLYDALRAYAATDDAAALRGAQARYLRKTLDDFKRHGAELADGDKKRLEEISRRLAELTSRFSQNVVDATAKFELLVDDESKLAGLPEAAVQAARESARAKGHPGWRFTLQAPSLLPVLTYLDDASIREQMYRAYNSRAAGGALDNVPIIVEVLRLRREEGQLLGYQHFADFVLEDRMAKTASEAQRFLQDLTSRCESAFEQERSELQQFRDRLEGNHAAMQPWDVGYYSEKQRKALYDFDEEALRPYFPAEAVLSGLFETAQRLYGITIRPNTQLPAWHEDVRTFDVVGEGGKRLASFYVDLYPRDEKRGGAWMNSLISGVVTGSESTPHLGLICTNVTPPVGDKPALLNHSEVTTLFHEFGHLLHHCLSLVSVRSLVGTNVAWDFVELPSQIMENWCWEREALDSFARHYSTGERIPDELFQKMLRARTYRAASATMRQLGFAVTDLALHVDYDEERDGNVITYAREIMQRFSTVPFGDDYAMLASFSHLFSSAVGYAAGYYSYKWAEVLDADAFTSFKQGGVFSREVGARFRECILEKGDSEDPLSLYERFMGRPPRLDALLERSGLASS